MPKVYVLVGVPGSGKSTWASNQDWAKDCAYVSTDGYVERFAQRLGLTYNDVFETVMPRAIRLMTRAVIKARAEGKDIIWDQTSTTVKSRKNKFRMLPDYDAIAVVFRTPDSAEWERRLSSRPGKSIPKFVLENMVKNWQEPTEEEGFDEIWYT